MVQLLKRNNNPENPIAVVEGEFIDGCSVELEVEEDTKYKFLIMHMFQVKLKNLFHRLFLHLCY